MNLLMGLFLGGIFAILAKVLVQYLPHSYIGKRGKPLTYLQCESCHAQIRLVQNLPFASLFSRCNICGSRFPFWFFWIDLSAILGSMLLFYLIDDYFILLKTTFFIVPSLILFFTDLKHQYVPDRISLFLFVSVLIFSVYLGDLKATLSAMGLVFLCYLTMAIIFKLIFRRDTVGGGDIKYAAIMAGFWGVEVTFMSLYIGYLISAIIGSILLLLKIKKRGDYIAFLPSFQLGLLIVCFYSEYIETFLFF